MLPGIRARWGLGLSLALCGMGLGGEEGATPERQQAREILETSGIRGGLIVHLGCGDGRLTAALRTSPSYLVHGLGWDPGRVEAARQHIQSLGLYGPVSVDVHAGPRLPYVDGLVNLLVAQIPGNVPMDEMMRVLAPEGVALVLRDGQWAKTVKPRPGDIDEWTHALHDATNNAVAHDAEIGPPRHLQWVGSPSWSRHHDHMASLSSLVSAGGRIFYIFDEGPTSNIELPSSWWLIARDGFNGVVLWRRPIAAWWTQMWPFKSGPAQLVRRLVAVGNRVYVTLGLEAPLTALDAATGQTVHTYEGSQGTEEVIASEGVLFVLANRAPIQPQGFVQKFNNVEAERARAAKEWPWDGAMREIQAFQAETGQLLWKGPHRVVPMTLAADAQSVYFHNGEVIVCLDRSNGRERWRSPSLGRRPLISTAFAPTLVAYQDVVLFSGGLGQEAAISARTGQLLWTAPHPHSGHMSPEDLLVVGGLVWSGATGNGNESGVFTGRDPHTGAVKSEFPPDVQAYWFHSRCHPSRATDKYLLPSRTGIEFVDIATRHWVTNHWTRGSCLYGIMPCNGMIYAPPNDCACYEEAKMCGFCALAPESATRRIPEKTSDEQRLEQGPAYAEPVEEAEAGPGDWPTYRHDAARSGCAATAVPAELKPAWQAQLGGKLSGLVAAGGKVFVATVDTHTIHALDEGTGKAAWSYTAGGRVDSPPTLWRGRALFGSADGWVYCLRAADGKLIWRFRAAPEDRRLMSYEQVESVWPVHGSVLVQNNEVYCVAGRSMFLDGGMRFLRLDPKTGRKISEGLLDERDPATGQNLQTDMRVLNMPVALPDILSSDGRHVYMRSQRFDLEGKRQPIMPPEVTEQQGEGEHLFCPSGLLDDAWFHRSYWIYGRSYAEGAGGWPRAGHFAPAGRMLVFDESVVYGFGRKPDYYKWTTPVDYELSAAAKEPKIVKGAEAPLLGPKLGKMPGKKGNPGQLAARITYHWSHDVPMLVHAMALADKTLFIAGPPEVVNEVEALQRFAEPAFQAKLREQAAALEGAEGAWVWAVSAGDGKKLGELKLESVPVFDGMIAAGGRLYVSMKSGKVVCLAGR